MNSNSFRLPDDVLQTAKVAKLLRLMESGKAAQYKNQNLDDIEIDVHEEADLEDENSDIGKIV